MSSGLVSGIISGPSATLASGPIYNADLSRTGAGLSKGPNVGKRNIEAGWAQAWPAPGATLDLDFVNDRGFVKGFGQGRSMDSLTYTRASDANYINANGVLSKAFYTVPPTPYVQTTSSTAVTNFEPYSEDFTNAAWTKNGLTVANNAVTPPTGFAAAQRITENSGAITLSAMYNRQNDAVQYPYNQVFSVFAKEDPTSAKRYLVLGMYYTGFNRWGWAVVDLAGRQYKTYTDGIQDAVTGVSFTDAGNGWARVSVAISSPLGGQYFSIGMIDKIVATNSYNLGGYTGDGTSGMFVTGAQLESPIINPYAQPRFDWSSTTQLPQNILTYSSPANVSAWTTIGSNFPASSNVSFGNLNSLTGLNTAASFTDVTASRLTRTLGTLASNNTLSFYVSNVTSTLTMSLSNPSAGGGSLTINSSYSVGLTGIVMGNAQIQSVGSGWYRVTVLLIFPSANIQISFTGGNVGTLLDMFQIEVSTFATNYKAQGAFLSTNTPLVATSTVNGLLIEEQRTNLALWCRDATKNQNFLTYSQAFDNAAWNYDGNAAFITRVPASTTAPDGSNTGQKIYSNTLSKTARNAYIGQANASLTTTFTSSVYMKAADYNYGIMTVGAYASGFWAAFDLINGIVSTAPTASGTTAAITSVGSGWYRCSITTTVASLKLIVITPSRDGTLDTGLTVNSGIYIWGGQLENGSVTQTYQPTTATTLPVSWVRTNITAALNQTGIDGISNSATSLTSTSGSATCIQQLTATSAAQVYSIYLKALTVTGSIQITIDGTTWSTVDLSNGLWNRVVLSATLANPCIGVQIQNSGDAVAMDFAQIEAGGAGYATTPIYTANVTTTRSVDSATMASPIFLPAYNQSGGTFIMNGYSIGISGANIYLMGLYGPTSGNIKLTGGGSGGYIRSFNNIPPTFDFNGNYGFTSQSFTFKQILSYRNGYAAMSVNGLSRAGSLTAEELYGCILPYVNNLNINGGQTAYIKSITYFPIVYNARTVREWSGT